MDLGFGFGTGLGLDNNNILIPGKSDSCTREELDMFRARIRNQLEEAKISVYR